MSKSVLLRLKHQAPNCKKCGGEMVEGKALIDNLSGVADFPNDTHACTVSPDGTARLVDCWKCKECGWSIT